MVLKIKQKLLIVSNGGRDSVDIPQAEDHKLPSFPHNMDPDMDLLYKPAIVTRTLGIFFYFNAMI